MPNAKILKIFEINKYFKTYYYNKKNNIVNMLFDVVFLNILSFLFIYFN